MQVLNREAQDAEAHRAKLQRSKEKFKRNERAAAVLQRAWRRHHASVQPVAQLLDQVRGEVVEGACTCAAPNGRGCDVQLEDRYGGTSLVLARCENGSIKLDQNGAETEAQTATDQDRHWTPGELNALTKIQAIQRGRSVRNMGRFKVESAHLQGTQTTQLPPYTPSGVDDEIAGNAELVPADSQVGNRPYFRQLGRLSRVVVSPREAPAAPAKQPFVRRRFRPADALTEEGVERWAQENLNKVMTRTIGNVPSMLPLPAFGEAASQVPLRNLPKDTQERLLRIARHEAEAWAEDMSKQVKAKRTMQANMANVQAKLANWHEQKEAMRIAEEERKRTEDEAKAEADRLEEQMRRRHAESLQRKLADTAVERAVRKEAEEREAAKREQEALEKDRLRWKRRGRALKWKLMRQARSGASTATLPVVGEPLT
eukprot:TRINITY_DN75201_c0_g1_i1.p1 TRINITY_DN75201_c0_g1~~TRINITY_DN75201_c0_g1_i1.p1  ORF type:complete len:462 (-),score=69.06 TRINITY_DN75201_c0_g1_i1:78-1364(-)